MKQPELGQLISKIRCQRKITQEELARKCNVNLRTIQRIESGKVNPRLYTLRIISDVLQYDFQIDDKNENCGHFKRYINYISGNFVIPKVSLYIIGCTFIGFILSIPVTILISDSLYKLAIIPSRIGQPEYWYTFISNVLLHGGLKHWFLNSVFIVLAGSFLEKRLSYKMLLLLILFTILAGPIIYCFTDNKPFIGSGFLVQSFTGASAGLFISRRKNVLLIEKFIIGILVLFITYHNFAGIGNSGTASIAHFIIFLAGFIYMLMVATFGRIKNTG